MARNEDKKILIGRRPVRSKNRREQGGGRADGITCQALSCMNLGFIDGFLNLGGLVTARVPAQVQETLEIAAAMVGATVNQFMVQAALREAERIIEQERVIRLSAHDAELFFQALDNPPPLNAKLKSSLRDHQGAKRDDEDSVFNWQPRAKRG